jgi:DNA-binding NarL/FixJ family response regulator
MDLGLPGVDGIETTRVLCSELPEANIVAVSAWDDRASVLGALHAGAKGYVTKNGDYTQLIRSVEAVGAGKGFLSPDVTVQLLRYLEGATINPSGTLLPPAWLTDRDRAMLRLIMSGASNRDIGHELFLSEHTVRTYLTEILGRLGLKNRVQLAIYAIKLGLA